MSMIPKIGRSKPISKASKKADSKPKDTKKHVPGFAGSNTYKYTNSSKNTTTTHTAQGHKATPSKIRSPSTDASVANSGIRHASDITGAISRITPVKDTLGTTHTDVHAFGESPYSAVKPVHKPLGKPPAVIESIHTRPEISERQGRNRTEREVVGDTAELSEKTAESSRIGIDDGDRTQLAHTSPVVTTHTLGNTHTGKDRNIPRHLQARSNVHGEGTHGKSDSSTQSVSGVQTTEIEKSPDVVVDGPVVLAAVDKHEREGKTMRDIANDREVVGDEKSKTLAKAKKNTLKLSEHEENTICEGKADDAGHKGVDVSTEATATGEHDTSGAAIELETRAQTSGDGNRGIVTESGRGSRKRNTRGRSTQAHAGGVQIEHSNRAMDMVSDADLDHADTTTITLDTTDTLETDTGNDTLDTPAVGDATFSDSAQRKKSGKKQGRKGGVKSKKSTRGKPKQNLSDTEHTAEPGRNAETDASSNVELSTNEDVGENAGASAVVDAMDDDAIDSKRNTRRRRQPKQKDLDASVAVQSVPTVVLSDTEESAPESSGRGITSGRGYTSRIGVEESVDIAIDAAEVEPTKVDVDQDVSSDHEDLTVTQAGGRRSARSSGKRKQLPDLEIADVEVGTDAGEDVVESSTIIQTAETVGAAGGKSVTSSTGSTGRKSAKSSGKRRTVPKKGQHIAVSGSDVHPVEDADESQVVEDRNESDIEVDVSPVGRTGSRNTRGRGKRVATMPDTKLQSDIDADANGDIENADIEVIDTVASRRSKARNQGAGKREQVAESEVDTLDVDVDVDTGEIESRTTQDVGTTNDTDVSGFQSHQILEDDDLDENKAEAVGKSRKNARGSGKRKHIAKDNAKHMITDSPLVITAEAEVNVAQDVERIDNPDKAQEDEVDSTSRRSTRGSGKRLKAVKDEITETVLDESFQQPSADVVPDEADATVPVKAKKSRRNAREKSKPARKGGRAPLDVMNIPEEDLQTLRDTEASEKLTTTTEGVEDANPDATVVADPGVDANAQSDAVDITATEGTSGRFDRAQAAKHRPRINGKFVSAAKTKKNSGKKTLAPKPKTKVARAVETDASELSTNVHATSAGNSGGAAEKDLEAGCVEPEGIGEVRDTLGAGTESGKVTESGVSPGLEDVADEDGTIATNRPKRASKKVKKEHDDDTETTSKAKPKKPKITPKRKYKKRKNKLSSTKSRSTKQPTVLGPLQCPFPKCTFVSHKPNDYTHLTSHQEVHAKEHALLLRCPHVSCGLEFWQARALNVHLRITEHHSTKRKPSQLEGSDKAETLALSDGEDQSDASVGAGPGKGKRKGKAGSKNRTSGISSPLGSAVKGKKSPITLSATKPKSKRRATTILAEAALKQPGASKYVYKSEDDSFSVTDMSDAEADHDGEGDGTLIVPKRTKRALSGGDGDSDVQGLEEPTIKRTKKASKKNTTSETAKAAPKKKKGRPRKHPPTEPKNKGESSYIYKSEDEDHLSATSISDADSDFNVQIAKAEDRRERFGTLVSANSAKRILSSSGDDDTSEDDEVEKPMKKKPRTKPIPVHGMRYSGPVPIKLPEMVRKTQKVLNPKVVLEVMQCLMPGCQSVVPVKKFGAHVLTHVDKSKPCECPFTDVCAKGFKQITGLIYHLKNNVVIEDGLQVHLEASIKAIKRTQQNSESRLHGQTMQMYAHYPGQPPIDDYNGMIPIPTRPMSSDAAQTDQHHNENPGNPTEGTSTDVALAAPGNIKRFGFSQRDVKGQPQVMHRTMSTTTAQPGNAFARVRFAPQSHKLSNLEKIQLFRQDPLDADPRWGTGGHTRFQQFLPTLQRTRIIAANDPKRVASYLGHSYPKDTVLMLKIVKSYTKISLKKHYHSNAIYLPKQINPHEIRDETTHTVRIDPTEGIGVDITHAVHRREVLKENPKKNKLMFAPPPPQTDYCMYFPSGVCGLAWAPNVDRKEGLERQFLALSVKDDYVTTSGGVGRVATLQIWDCGMLENHVSDQNVKKYNIPRLALVVALKGTAAVKMLTWAPCHARQAPGGAENRTEQSKNSTETSEHSTGGASEAKQGQDPADIQKAADEPQANNSNTRTNTNGCHGNAEHNTGATEKGALSRLGVLAVTDSEGIVRLYSVPNPSDVRRESNASSDKDTGIVHLVPSAVLLRPSSHSQCTSLDWGISHKIAVGTLEGMVVIYDLSRWFLDEALRPPEKTVHIAHSQRWVAEKRPVNQVRWHPHFEQSVLMSSAITGEWHIWDTRDTATALLARNSYEYASVTYWPNSLGSFYTASCFGSIREHDVVEHKLEPNWVQKARPGVVPMAMSYSLPLNALASAFDDGVLSVYNIGLIHKKKGIKDRNVWLQTTVLEPNPIPKILPSLVALKKERALAFTSRTKTKSKPKGKGKQKKKAKNGPLSGSDADTDPESDAGTDVEEAADTEETALVPVDEPISAPANPNYHVWMINDQAAEIGGLPTKGNPAPIPDCIEQFLGPQSVSIRHVQFCPSFMSGAWAAYAHDSGFVRIRWCGDI